MVQRLLSQAVQAAESSVTVFRTIRALLLALSGAVVTLAQLNLPADFWSHHKGSLWASVSVLALLILMDAGNELTYAFQERQIRTYDKDLRSILSGAAGAMVTLSGVPWDQVAVRYYRKRGWLHRPRLRLVAAIMAGADVEEPRRNIKPGVGVVGTAFKDQEVIIEEWAAFVRQANAERREAWEKRPAESRYGLTWGQLQHQTSRPDAMIASPTFAASGDPTGCILLSGALKLPDLESEGTRRILEDLATSLDRLGSPPRGWWRAHER
jgi:hypothetical protein